MGLPLCTNLVTNFQIYQKNLLLLFFTPFFSNELLCSMHTWRSRPRVDVLLLLRSITNDLLYNTEASAGPGDQTSQTTARGTVPAQTVGQAGVLTPHYHLHAQRKTGGPIVGGLLPHAHLSFYQLLYYIHHHSIFIDL